MLPGSNEPACIGASAAPMTSSVSAAQNSVDAFKTSGSAEQNPGPKTRDLSLCCRAPGRPRASAMPDVRNAKEDNGVPAHHAEIKQVGDPHELSHPKNDKNSDYLSEQDTAGRT